MRISFFFLFSFIPELLLAQAQEVRVNNLKSELYSAANEPDRVRLLGEISFAYLWTNSDSAIFYAQEQLSRALKGGFREEEILAYKNLSNSLVTQGAIQSALQYMLQAMRFTEEMKSDSLFMIIYGGLGALYYEIEQTEDAVKYLQRSLSLSQKLGDVVRSCHNLVNLGITYLDSDQLDSALHYTQMAYSKALAIGKWDYDMIGAIQLHTGNIQYKLNNKEIALAYYRKALSSAMYYADWIDVAEIHHSLADYYLDAGKKDSALHHYHESLQAADRIAYNKLKVKLSRKLSDIYKNINIDSAFKYISLELNIKDSLFNDQQARSQQDMIFRERLYQEEKETALLRSAKERKTNLQLLGIVVFIIGFFSLIIVFARIRIRPVVVEWMGIIALLMLFEFIALLIHPLIEEWTDHSPVLMLMILMSIAAGMGPLHHKIKSSVLSRLTGKTQKIS